ncbi:MAG: VOC family protein [Thermoleophilaceae bacterium]
MTARLGWVIVYVPDVAAAVELYGRAFGLQPRFATKGFAELETGATALAFASDVTASQNMGHPFHRAGLNEPRPTWRSPSSLTTSMLRMRGRRAAAH